MCGFGWDFGTGPRTLGIQTTARAGSCAFSGTNQMMSLVGPAILGRGPVASRGPRGPGPVLLEDQYLVRSAAEAVATGARRSVGDGGSLRPIIVECEARVRLARLLCFFGGTAVGYVGHKKAFHGREIVDAEWARSLLRLLLGVERLRRGYSPQDG